MKNLFILIMGALFFTLSCSNNGTPLSISQEVMLNTSESKAKVNLNILDDIVFKLNENTASDFSAYYNYGGFGRPIVDGDDLIKLHEDELEVGRKGDYYKLYSSPAEFPAPYTAIPVSQSIYPSSMGVPATAFHIKDNGDFIFFSYGRLSSDWHADLHFGFDVRIMAKHNGKYYGKIKYYYYDYLDGSWNGLGKRAYLHFGEFKDVFDEFQRLGIPKSEIKYYIAIRTINGDYITSSDFDSSSEGRPSGYNITEPNRTELALP